MKFNKDIEITNISKSERTYLNSEEEKKKAREETEECECCGLPSDNLINCGIDCIYHKPREGHLPCRCTKKKAGENDLLIECRNYCSFKKKSLKEKFNLEDIEL